MEEEKYSTQERLERERAFHNERFEEEDNRNDLDKWYIAVSHGAVVQRRLIRDLSQQKIVLEYGCAYAETALNEYRLHECAKEIHGIDIADIAIEKAKARAEELGATNAFFTAGNAEAMPYPDETFDLVFGRGIIHHLDLDKSFAELVRVLKPGGVISFYEPMGHNPFLNWYRNRTPELRTPDEHPIVTDDFGLVRKYFSEIKIDYYGLATLASVPLGRKMLQPLRVLDKLLLSIPWLNRNAWYVLITARK